MNAEPDVPAFEPNTDELLVNNDRFAATFSGHGLALRPVRSLAVVACMDSRMDIFAMLGLGHGEAHIIRNAGGVVTEDVIRSLVLSQRLLGTREIILIHHTDCGLQKVVGQQWKDELEQETGHRPGWDVHGFEDPYTDVRESILRLRADPFLADRDHVRGFVYRVDDGHLDEVTV